MHWIHWLVTLFFSELPYRFFLIKRLKSFKPLSIGLLTATRSGNIHAGQRLGGYTAQLSERYEDGRLF
ncbi:hypothetical protein F6Y04_06630 [Bacillus megaterium]|nr:hypothetical protein [Priestia megaterium]